MLFFFFLLCYIFFIIFFISFNVFKLFVLFLLTLFKNKKSMKDNNLEKIFVKFTQEIHNSSNLSNDLDDSFPPILMNEYLIIKCPECFHFPRMIFEIIDKKLSIKVYCYSHNKIEKYYNLKAFIDKFGISKEEVIDTEYSLNKSQSLLNFDIENKDENVNNILVIDDDFDIGDKTDYCKHQNGCKKYCELGDFIFCDSCNLNQMMNDKNLNIYYNNVRIENIYDLHIEIEHYKYAQIIILTYLKKIIFTRIFRN